MYKDNSKLIQQLSNIAKKQSKDKVFSRSTQRRWEKLISNAFDVLDINQYKYLNKKDPGAIQRAIIKASNTLANKLAKHDIKASKQYEEDLIKGKAELKELSKQNIQTTDLNIKTQNLIARKGMLPERMDIDNMDLKQIQEAKKLMNLSPELRALGVVQEYAFDYFERYFEGIKDDPGIAKRLHKIALHFKNDFIKLQDIIELTNSESFKGGYGDTDEMLKQNSDLSIQNTMYDRLSRLENLLF